VASGRSLEQSLLGKTAEAAAPEMAPGEQSVVRSSKSKRPTTGGMTLNDLNVLKKYLLENPDAATEDIQTHLTNERLNRSAGYRINAGLDKGAQTAMELDQP